MPIQGNGMNLSAPFTIEPEKLLKPAADPAEPVPQAAKEPPRNASEELTGNVDIPEDHHELLRRIRENSQHTPNQPPPVGPTVRQAEQTRLEMEAGAKRSAYYAEQEAKRPRPAPEPNQGTNTEVPRSGEYQYEPGLSQGKRSG